jgi:hypothetical protein
VAIDADLLAAAHRLEAEAIAAGEEEPRGRELRAEAAALRVRALGPRPYPIEVCRDCLHLTGWRDAAGSCSSCLVEARVRSAFSDPAGGWVALHDERPPLRRAERAPLRARLAASLGRRQGLDRAAAHAWLARVDPGETGPVSPETGYEVEAATREEVDAPEGAGLLVRFATARYRFNGAGWAALDRTKLSQAALLVPAEFSAGLPVEQLAEAWGDYRAEVAAFNRSAWDALSSARDAERRAREERADALRRQRHTSELLDETD